MTVILRISEMGYLLTGQRRCWTKWGLRAVLSWLFLKSLWTGVSPARKTCSVQRNCDVCKDSTRLPLKLSRASAESFARILNPKLKPSFDFLVIKAFTSAIIWPSLFFAWHQGKQLCNYYSCSHRHLKHLPRVTDFVKIIGLELSSVTILWKIYVSLTCNI